MIPVRIAHKVEKSDMVKRRSKDRKSFPLVPLSYDSIHRSLQNRLIRVVHNQKRWNKDHVDL